mmetsp:Transcript_31249/g.57156  ORF Transcript_31249/g.57156 Transcript_31249/m.57156 type:complete len:608 (+) Transcript_31249:97-1920(+)
MLRLRLAADGSDDLHRRRREASVLVTAAVLLSALLQGCDENIYEETCVWHNDVTVKGCPWVGFQQCIQHCTFCVNSDGPDECAQLKCAAYCAKKEEGSCLSNFKELCLIAVNENFPSRQVNSSAPSCDVDCSAASRPGTPSALLLAVAISVASGWHSGLRLPHALCLACLVLSGLMLQGCECTDPEPQLGWKPDSRALQDFAGWYDEDGVWRGNPTWNFDMELEVEDYECKQMHQTRGVCVVWSVHEWNCGEHDYGICKCHELHPVHDHCQRWGCHTLEADQQKCWFSDNSDNSEHCEHEQFPMDENVYNQLMEEASKANTDADSPEMPWWHDAAEEVFPGIFEAFPPEAAFRPTYRKHYFEWGSQCIINGDNKVRAYRHCRSTGWREVETEIQQCNCTESASTGKACLRWHCEERDVGLFSILFRTQQPISAWTEGVESEDYECKEFDRQGHCQAWEGHIRSQEEVEVTRCECTGDGCHYPGAVWRCDEYELPRTLHWQHDSYSIWATILLPIICEFGFLACSTLFLEGGGPAGFCCVDTCLACVAWPFYIVSFGFYAFLAVGGAFWGLRLASCCMFGCMVLAAGLKDGISDLTSVIPSTIGKPSR